MRYAQNLVSANYARYSRIANRRGLTGGGWPASCSGASIHDVGVEPIAGRLTDHYDPRVRKVRLSQEIYYGRSLAALGIAAHETGHALQHQEQYTWLAVRNSIVPVVQFGSQLAFPLLLFGLLFSAPSLMDIGILLFVGAVVFQLITLPVEFNASQRAVAMLSQGGYLAHDEIQPVKTCCGQPP